MHRFGFPITGSASTRLVIATATLLLTGWVAPRRPVTDIAPNDNAHAAGTLANGVLTVALETRIGNWQPDGAGGRSIDSIAAFAEVGHAPTTPGPLIRVPVGTDIHGTVHNTLERPLTIIGLRGYTSSDSMVIPAGETLPFAFHAERPGTYLYTAHTRMDPVNGRDPSELQLGGAVVVDAPNPPPDRVMVISWFYSINPKSPNGLGIGTMAINGRSWPHTERLSYTQGDSVRWRVVNLTELDHPMHLHGFYFRVDSRNGEGTDTLYTPAQQRMAVTEMINPFTTVTLAWKADRSGNWVFHCHYATHVSNFVTLDTKDGMFDSTMMAHHPSNGPHQMFGLVMGVTVTPKGPAVAAGEPQRRIRIEQREKANVYGDQPGMSYVVTDTKPVDAAAMPVPGPVLILERGKRVEVKLVNESSQHAAVHWHGIELESYPDGVPGWSGSGNSTYPAIPPHDSLTVRWTPPRAGSFMYHSHFNEPHQMGGGLYGPIIVLDPGQKYDSDADRTLFFGAAGAVISILTAPPEVLLNGSAHPAPMEFTAGKRYRLRLFNLAGDNPTFVSMSDAGKPVSWRALAKDGYPLPPSQATVMPAIVVFDPGEIYDFEFTPTHTGEYVLSFGLPQPPPAPPAKPGDPPPPPSPVPPLVHVAVHVR